MRLSIRTWLAGVSLLALLPLLCFSALVVYHQVIEQQAVAQSGLQRRAQAAAAVIGNDLDGVFTALTVMSQLVVVRSGDWRPSGAGAARGRRRRPRGRHRGRWRQRRQCGGLARGVRRCAPRPAASASCSSRHHSATAPPGC